MSQDKDETSETNSTVEVDKNKRAWAEMVKKANIALQKIKKKKAKMVEKKVG